MKTKNIFLIAGLLFSVLTLNAQDVHFSQLTETPLLLNPAQAGLSHNAMAIINYKDQWRAVGKPYTTINTSFDMAFMKKDNGSHLGAGIDVYSDKAGDAAMSTTTAQLHLAGIVAANDHNLFSAGLYGGFGQRSLNYSKLEWDNQYDGTGYDPSRASLEPTTFANHNYLDLGAGLAWFYGAGHSTLSSNDARTFNLGASLQHINQPLYSFYAATNQHLPMRTVLYGNADIGVKNYNVVLEPSYIVMIQAGHHEINAGIMFKYIMQEASKYTGRKKPAAFVFGGYYRFGDAVCIAARYEFSNWSIGTSYDVNLSNLKTVSNARGGFEISLRYMSPDPFGKGTTSRLFD
ncbi:MAG: PorP/SprF family type IX secretion system membrane protein [Bacteroidetes bacterium]|nr:PorP/SprF family type IX secretion system membrane protein [Bacteroidota bacterium]